MIRAVFFDAGATLLHPQPPVEEVYEDVLPALDGLGQRGLPLAIVSNWDSYLPTLLEALGLHGRFRTISVSAIEEVGKPDPEIFLRTCRRMDVEPAHVLHVGDSLAEDYQAARAAGLSALLLDRTGRHPSMPDRIASLAELTARL